MIDAEKIENARKTLMLGESATIPEIKEAYRKLSLKYHPDKSEEKDKKRAEDRFKELNNANQVLIEYCMNYRIFFGKSQDPGVSQENTANEHYKRFYDGWWGDLNNG